MDKSDFFHILKESLKPLSKEECNKFINYYEEIIEDYKENGFTEKEAIKKIGNPKTIANDILREQDRDQVKIPSSSSKILTIILLILGFPLWGSLLLTAILLVLSAYIVIWCIPFTTGVSSIALFMAALLSIIGSPFMIADILAVGVVQLGVGIIALGSSILLAFATIYLSKKFIFVTKKLTLKLSKVFKRRVVSL